MYNMPYGVRGSIILLCDVKLGASCEVVASLPGGIFIIVGSIVLR